MTESPAKLCVVMASHMLENIGGAQLQSHHFSNYAQDNGWQTYYLCRHDKPLSQQSYEIISLGTRSRVFKGTFFEDALGLFKHLKRLRPTTIYQRGLKSHTGLCALYCMFNRRCKLVFHLANEKDVNGERTRIVLKDLVKPQQIIEKALSYLGLRCANVVVAQTHAQDQLMRRLIKRSADLVVNNVFVPSVSATDRASSNKFRVLWVSNLKEQKRPEVVLDLAELLAGDSSVEIEMIGRPYGNPKSREEFESRLESCENVSFLGEKTPAEVEHHMANADVFLSTSRIEGYPNTFVQAFSYGLPVISFEVDIDSIITKHKLGKVCNSVSELAEAIRVESQEDTDTLKKTKRIKDFAKQQFGLDNFSPLLNLMLT
ncbi:MAG: glycosyltransferase family 4 protein [Pseudomonadota bacterium]